MWVSSGVPVSSHNPSLGKLETTVWHVGVNVNVLLSMCWPCDRLRPVPSHNAIQCCIYILIPPSVYELCTSLYKVIDTLGESSKMSHVLVMSLDCAALVEKLCCVAVG